MQGEEPKKKKLLGLETVCRYREQLSSCLLPFFSFFPLLAFFACLALPQFISSLYLSSLHQIHFISSHLIPKEKKSIYSYVRRTFLFRFASPPYLLGRYLVVGKVR